MVAQRDGVEASEQVEASGRRVLRPEGEQAHQVTFFELFFDLVFVFSITQLSQGLLERLTISGAFQTLLLLLAVWWAWVYTAWATNWLDPDNRLVRLVLIAVMGASLVMSVSLPEAFGDRGLVFAAMYTFIQIGRSSFVLWAFRNHPIQRRNFTRIVSWNVAACAIWLAGGFAGGTTREVIWVIALLVDYAGPAASFRIPFMGPSQTSDWTVTGSHFAERFKLFVILALGESVLVIGATFSGLEPSATTLAAFGVAFVGSVALWWIYFDQAADAATGVLRGSTDPGRLARDAYTYFHLPIAAGIIVTAVADELIIAHPDGHADAATVAVTLGGPALFLLGHALYKRAIFGVISVPRVTAIIALAVLAPVGTSLAPLVLGALAALVVVVIAVWDTVRTHPDPEVAR